MTSKGARAPALAGALTLLAKSMSRISTRSSLGKTFLQIGVVNHMTTDGFAHHGVLSHENDGLTTEGNTDLLHLLGSDIVSIDQETLGVFVQKLFKLGKIFDFPL